MVGEDANDEQVNSLTSSSSCSDETFESDDSITTTSDDTSCGSSSITSSSDKSCPLSSTGATTKLALVDDNGVFLDEYSSSVRQWTEMVPIGMNLCPWAKVSHREGRIKYVTCHEDIQTPEKASKIVWEEIEKLLGGCCEPLPAWSTTLVVCPHVKTWVNDYRVFERFVREFGKEETLNIATCQEQPIGSEQPNSEQVGAITLVPFHPQFLRWKGLPDTISNGSKILCHRGLAGFSKSPDVYPATVIELSPKGFGRRRIRVRFHEDQTKDKEQCIPLDWVQLSELEVEERPILPDNAMHRAPYPVIHILRNDDLKSLTIQEISRLKRRNAKRMATETLS